MTKINPKTLTSANSVVMVRCRGVYDEYFQLEGYQADNAFSFGDSAIGETRMGVDGILSGGYTPHTTQITVALEANSPSRTRMENIRKWFNSRKETAPVDFIIEIPSIGERQTGSGFMVNLTGGPSAQKLLAGTQYIFDMAFDGPDEM